LDHGLLRIHNQRSGAEADSLALAAFPDFRDRVACFAFDWLGRQFSLDSERRQGTEPLVLMFEPGTGEVLEIPVTVRDFLESEIVDAADAALARSFYLEWMESSGVESVGFTECVGYRVPLFLGGADTVDNLEIVDISVYWSILGQIRAGTVNAPMGTEITEIELSGDSSGGGTGDPSAES
jgi:hypothetical protein